MFEERIRRLLEDHRRGRITSDDAQAELARLAARAQAMHPIPVDQAVDSMADLARKRPGSAMGEESDGKLRG